MSDGVSPILFREFGNWCLMRMPHWYWELCWMGAIYLGAVQLKKDSVISWAKHAFDAYLSGCWFLVWTDTHLYWVQKPIVKIERLPNRRLHCDDGPACENDIENLYFLHGILVPAYAVVQPDLITLDEIEAENNVEVKRTLIEQWGWERYIRESKSVVINERYNERDQQKEVLYRIADGSHRVMLTDPSTGRRYVLGVPRDVETCAQAQNYLSHGLDRLAIHRS